MAKLHLIKTRKELPYNHVTQPLGLMYIASFLLREKRHEVKITDMAADNLSVEEACKNIEEDSPTVVGLSALSVEASVMHMLAKKIKEISPEITVIIGGPHAASDPKSILSDEHIDYLVRGEGEETMKELLEALDHGNPVSGIRGISYRKNGKIVTTPPRPFMDDLDALPFPAWELIKVEKYFDLPTFNIFYASKRYMSIFTSRGCPYHCTYCHNIFGKRFRARTPENVFQEIEYLYKTYGIREFQIVDDSFNVKKERAKNICDLIIRSGLKIFLTFPNGVRGDIVDQELLLKLKQAGTYKITYAIETASPRLQKLLRKNINLPKLQDTITLTNKLGILTHGFFMAGFPTETKEELQLTTDYAKKSKLNTLGLHVLTPFPGTEIYNQILEMGKSTIANDSLDYTIIKSNFSEFTAEELLKKIRKTLILFYLNPKRVVNTIMLTPNKRQFWEFIKLFFNRLTYYSIPKKSKSC